MDSIEFAKALFAELPMQTSVNSTAKETLPANNTTTLTTSALSDSVNGTVIIDIDGSACEVETTVSVKNGDTVYVSITGNTPVVTGVLAGGDRTMDAINELLLKRSTNLLDLSQEDDFDVTVANSESATGLSHQFLNDNLQISATETPEENVQYIDLDVDVDPPTESASGEEVTQPTATEVYTSNANSFIVSTKEPISLQGGYIISAKVITNGISGQVKVKATYEKEIELFPTGEEEDYPEGSEDVVSYEQPTSEVQMIVDEFIVMDIPEQVDDSPVEFDGKFVFEADGDYSFEVVIGDNFDSGEVIAQLFLDLETKEFIDASGAITRATELAEDAKELVDEVDGKITEISNEFDDVKQSVENIEGTVSKIEETTKPVLDAIDEIKGESDNFKEGLTKLIDSTASDKFATKNDLLEYTAEFNSNITQTASRIEFSVTEDDITDISPEAEDSVEQAMEKYLLAQSQYQDAQKAYSKALSDNAIAASILDNAADQLRLVEEQVNSILENEDISPTDKATAQKILDDAQAAFDEADAKYQSIQSVFGEIEQDLASADNILQLAFQKLSECQDSHTASKAELSILSNEISSKVSQTAYDADMQQVNSQYTSLSQTAGKLEIDFANLSEDQEVLKYVRFENGNVILGGSESDARVEITQAGVSFMQGNFEVAHIEGDNLFIKRVKVTEQLEVNNWKWKQRGGNISFRYIEDKN